MSLQVKINLYRDKYAPSLMICYRNILHFFPEHIIIILCNPDNNCKYQDGRTTSPTQAHLNSFKVNLVQSVEKRLTLNGPLGAFFLPPVKGLNLWPGQCLPCSEKFSSRNFSPGPCYKRSLIKLVCQVSGLSWAILKYILTQFSDKSMKEKLWHT